LFREEKTSRERLVTVEMNRWGLALGRADDGEKGLSLINTMSS
jgi:hypothetical protein